MLALVAAMSKVDISKIESRHAAVRRRLMARGVQTHGMNIAGLSSEWVLDTTRKEGRQWGKAPHEVSRREKAAAAPASRDDGKRPTQTRPGGPWRAFVRDQSFGGAGLADSSALAIKYANLSAEEKARYDQIGQDATESRRSGAKGISSFGITSRELKKAQHRQRLEATVQRAQLVETPPSIPAARMDRTSAAVDHALALPGVQNMASLVSVARAVVERENQKDRDDLRVDKERFAEWLATVGQSYVRSFAEIHPSLHHISVALDGEPMGRAVTAVRYKHPTAYTAAVYKAVQQLSRRCNVGQSLLLDWIDKHQMILHNLAPAIQEKKPKK